MKYRHLIFFSLLVLAASCRRETKPAPLTGPEGTTPIELRIGATPGAFTRGLIGMPTLLSRSMTIAGDCEACLTVERTPMDGAATRAFTPVTEGNCNELYISIFKDLNDASSGNFVYTNRLFEKNEDGVFREFQNQLFWPPTSVDFRFYISNIVSTDGRHLPLDGTEDVVWTDAAVPYKETCAANMEHIYASIGTVAIDAPTGSEVNLVSVSLTAHVAGVYDMYDYWWDSFEPARELNLVEGANNTLLVEGRYDLKVRYELTDASITGLTQTVETSGKVNIVRGCVNNITIHAASSFRHELSAGGARTMKINHESNQLVYLDTWFVPSSGEDEVLLDTRLLTHEDDVEWSVSPEGIVVITPNPALGPEYWDIDATGVGTATVTVKYKDLQCSIPVTVLDYETDIEVRNMRVTLDCPDDYGHVSPAGEILSFLVGASFEYRVLYASGATSDWYDGNSNDGPIEYDRFYSDFGFSMIPYLKNENPKGYFRTEGTDGDFNVIVSPNRDTDKTHTATVGIRLTVNGESVSDEMDISQDMDAVASTEYRSLQVTIQVDSKSSIVEGPSEHTVDYVVSSTAEVRRTMLSGNVTDWQRESVNAQTSVILVSGSSFITLMASSNRFRLAENTSTEQAAPRQGVLLASASFQGLTDTGELTVTQIAGGLSHMDYRNLRIYGVQCPAEFFAIGSKDVPVTVHGGYDQRAVYNSVDPEEDDWINDVFFFDEKPSALYIVANGTPRLPGNSDWISYNADRGTITVKPNYSAKARSLTLRAKAVREDANGCYCEDAPDSDGWITFDTRDFTITQAPTTILEMAFRFQSPTSADWTDALGKDDCVFELYEIDTEHGRSNRHEETDPGMLDIWSNITYRIDNLKLYLNGNRDSEPVRDNGGMVMSPSPDTFDGPRSVTWNDVRKALRSNYHVSYPNLQHLRYTADEVRADASLNSTYSKWTPYYDCDVEVRFGGVTYSRHIGSKLTLDKAVEIYDMEIRNASLSITPIGVKQDEEDENHYKVGSVSSFTIELFGYYEARYKLRLATSTGTINLCDWTDWENVKFTNFDNAIEWYYPTGRWDFQNGTQPFLIESRLNPYFGGDYYEQGFHATFKQGSTYLHNSVYFVPE